MILIWLYPMFLRFLQRGSPGSQQLAPDETRGASYISLQQEIMVVFMGFQWDINGFLMDFNARSCDWRIGASRLLGDTVGITNGYNYGDNLQSWDIGLFAPLITAPLSRPSTMPCHKMEVPQMDHNSPWLLVWTHFCSWDTVPILIG